MRMSRTRRTGETLTLTLSPRERELPTKGFTLVELLVVIAIIGVLVALLLPAVQTARESARRMQCVTNLKQMALAVHNYAEVHAVYPPGHIIPRNMSGANGHQTIAPWQVTILPFIEQKGLWDIY